ncbi:MAG: alpha/beta fold hydrolase [Candidatus Brocadiia bacterium]|nr:alpha/beta fold hydrolase [Candidatus Brocadiia bacterium]
MPKVQVGDVLMSYYDNGTGDLPLLLVHGFPLDKRMWEPQIERLLYEFRVVTPDLRGHGESQAAPGPYTMELLADDLKGFLDAMGIPRVALGGFSMGGYVAFAFYRKYPAMVQSLLLLDTRPQSDSEEAKAGREDMAQLAEREGAGPIAERLLPRMLTADTVAGRPDVVDRARRMMIQCSPQAVAGDLRGIALRADASDLLPTIAVPTLIVVGEEDAVAPPADSELMAAAIPDATLVKVPKAGHLSNLEDPTAFNAAIRDFLRAH